MEFFIDLALLGLLVLGTTAFLGLIGVAIVKLFSRKNTKEVLEKSMQSKEGWRKLER